MSEDGPVWKSISCSEGIMIHLALAVGNPSLNELVLCSLTLVQPTLLIALLQYQFHSCAC